MMKTLYLDCQMGAAGDMLMAALLELLPAHNDFLDRINRLGIPGVTVACGPSEKCGVTGSHITVRINGEEEISEDSDGSGDRGQGNGHAHIAGEEHEHEHGQETAHDPEHGHIHEHEHSHDHGLGADHHSKNGLHEIEHLISGHINLSDKVRKDVIAVYRLIADAESLVHGEPAEQIHFSEVGSMDALADITGVCMLMESLAPDLILASPVHVGSGQVRCAHGILPVPAPATAYILRDVPIYGGKIAGELCTPTGAALLKHFASKFGPMPVMTVSSIGYGMGTKNFEAANCVRAFWGHTDNPAGAADSTSPADPAGAAGDNSEISNVVSEISCNLDDMTPEAIGFVQELLFKSGALDVYTIAIGMKKSRPGILLCCMCEKKNTDAITNLILRHTSTLGVRVSQTRRVVLRRTESSKETPYGPVRIKNASGNGFSKSKPEYEDIAKIAGDNDMTLTDVMDLLK